MVDFESKVREKVPILRAFARELLEVAAQDKRPLPQNPIVQNWTGLQIAKVFEAVSGDDLLRFYSRFSDWHHWNFAGLAWALEVVDGRVSFNSKSMISAAQGDTFGFQTLFQICEHVDSYFETGIQAKLEELKNRYLQTAGLS